MAAHMRAPEGAVGESRKRAQCQAGDRDRSSQIRPAHLSPPSALCYFVNHTFDIRGMRNGTNPFTSERTACILVIAPNGTA